jgi:hypothetical protein
MQLKRDIEDWIVANRLPSTSDPEGAIPVARFRGFIRHYTADLVVEVVNMATTELNAEWVDLVVSVREGMYGDGESLTGSVSSDLSHHKTSTSCGGQQG